MNALLLREDFLGSVLEGRAPNINALGPDAVWNYAGPLTEIAGGYFTCATLDVGYELYAVASILTSPAADVGGPMRYSWRWKPAGAPADFSNWSYPLGINFQGASMWSTVIAGVCTMTFSTSGGDGKSESVEVTFAPDTWYEGEIILSANQQTLNFLGVSIELDSVMLPEEMVAGAYINMTNAQVDGVIRAGLLDFIQIEGLPQGFWRQLVNTVERQ